jgi:hypothetical protein
MATRILAVTAGAIGLVSIITIVVLWSTGIVQPTDGDVVACGLATICGLPAVVLGIICFRSLSGKVGVGMGILSLVFVSFLVLSTDRSTSRSLRPASSPGLEKTLRPLDRETR